MKYFNIYNEKVKSKIKFLYGRKQGEFLKKRRKLFLLSPVIMALFTVLGLLFELGLSSVPFGIFVTGIILTFSEYRIFDMAKKKKRKIRLGLSEFCEGIAILLDAGIPLWSAIRSVSERMDDDGALGTEIKEAFSVSVDWGIGFGMEKAFFQLAEKCEDSSVSTFVSLVLQNARKGEDEISDMLRIHSVNLRNERRSIAKQMADEASTLMLLPSVMVLASIMVLIGAPAIIGLMKI